MELHQPGFWSDYNVQSTVTIYVWHVLGERNFVLSYCWSVTEHVQLCDPMTQHASLPCPSRFHGVRANSCPLASDAIKPSHPLLLFSFCLHSFPASGVFPSESALCIRWSKFWSYSISPSSEYSGLVSFGIDWFDNLPVRGTLKGLLQHHSLKASILWCSAFFMVQFSHLYMTTGETIAFTM